MPFDAKPQTQETHAKAQTKTQTKTKTQTPAVAVLQEAKRILERDGWCQRTAHDEKGRHCLGFAVAAATRSVRPEMIAQVIHRQVLEALLRVSGVRTGGVAKWNDDPDRTRADIDAIIDRAIDILQARAFADDLLEAAERKSAHAV